MTATKSASLEEEVFIRLLCQHVGRLCDGTKLSQASSDLQVGLFPELLLLLLDLLQPGRVAVRQFQNFRIYTVNNMVLNVFSTCRTPPVPFHPAL